QFSVACVCIYIYIYIYSPCILVSRCVFVIICCVGMFIVFPRVPSCFQRLALSLCEIDLLVLLTSACTTTTLLPIPCLDLFAIFGLPTCVLNPASKTFHPLNLPLC